ncbi:MAG: hypothetical protein EBV28_12570, partial [Betaproteobacteria bacterium]|nr:hypothetical protein [Betaproteobacteria bacterium]
CLLQLALGNIGVSGGGANIFRGHDNVQGITDVGMNPDSLPGYYGIADGAFKHYAAVWGVDFDWIKSRYAAGMMNKPGLTISRWFDAVLEKNEVIDQPSNLRAMFYWGHAPNSQTRGLELKRALDKLDMLVVVDPFPSATAAMAAMPGKAEDLNPNRTVYLLPACTQFETSGSVTASNRSIQWREKVMEPLYSTRPELVEKYPTHTDQAHRWRLPILYKSVQEKNKDVGKTFPLILTSGRLVEYEGGGDETRSNRYLAELQQDMFIEINPAAANDRGIRNGEWVWVTMPTGAKLKVRALVTERVDKTTTFMPYHFAGTWQGVDMKNYYPAGSAPIVRGEAVNTGTTYGYDIITMMQETKTTVCQVERAA